MNGRFDAQKIKEPDNTAVRTALWRALHIKWTQNRIFLKMKLD